MKKLDYALEEQIGDPDLFVGRKKELEYFLRWCQGVKERFSQSIGILSRRKKGKTALVQRLYNNLFHHQDPELVPFYFMVPEVPHGLVEFSVLFYQSLLTQYFAFRENDPALVEQNLRLEELKEYAGDDKFLAKDISQMEQLEKKRLQVHSWEHAQNAGHRISKEKNQRIIQIIDEFQYLNEFIYTDETHSKQVPLASSYTGPAQSKISPQIVTGSYIGWLSAILRKMVGRYQEYYLQSLTDKEALEAVDKYCGKVGVKISKNMARYIASSGYNDPFYISQIIRSLAPEKDLTTEKGVEDTLHFETNEGEGMIAKTWQEYIFKAFEQINGEHRLVEPSKKVVLYLAKYGKEERNREQIREDNNLTSFTDRDLEILLHKLVKADILAKGSSNFHFRGLGDEIFEVVFRKIYEPEIKKLKPGEIEKAFEKKFSRTEKQLAHYKGLNAEYRVMCFVHVAMQRKAMLSDIVYDPKEDFVLPLFHSIQKHRFYITHDKSIEIDLYAQSKGEEEWELLIEVKDWKRKLTKKVVEEFIQKKKLLTKILKKKTVYIFYSEQGFTEEQKKLLKKNNIHYSDKEKLREF